MNKIIKLLTATTLTIALGIWAAACGSSSDSNQSSASTSQQSASSASDSSSSASASSGGVTKVQIAYSQGGYPTEYVDENGKLTGYDIEVMRLVDELLPDYEFEYTGLDQTAVYAGLSTGKFQIALTNAFWTPEREAKYLFPKENIGASILGFFTRPEHSDVKTLSDAARKKLKLSPILAGDGNYYVIVDYNNNNPDNQIELTPTDDSNAFTEAYDWVYNGRYDFGLIPLQYWNALVVDEKGAFHKYNGKLSYNTFGAVKTWAIFAKGQEALAAEYDKAIAKLKAEGKLVELSNQFYGYNNFEYLDENSR